VKTVRERTLAPAIGALALAAIFFVTALARAVAVEPAPTVEPIVPDPVIQPDGDDAPAVPPDASRPVTLDAVRMAADVDPFQPDRQRAERYVLPSERQVDVEGPPPLPPAPPFQLVGTAVVGESGLAVVSLEDEVPRLLQVGDLMEGYRLTKVQPFGATMEGMGRSLDLHVTPPSPNPRVAESRGGRGTQRGRGNSGDQVRTQLMRQFEMLRQRGASQQVLQQFLERMRDAGVEELRSDDGRITIDDEGRIVVRRNNENRETPEPPRPRPRN
jgi:hypothetical protein